MNRLGWSIPLFLLSLLAGAQNPSINSRQASPRPAAPQDPQAGATSAQALIKQLEARQERPLIAPDGFEYFQGEGYRFLVPSPMELEGREGNFTKISVMSTRMLVLAGDPIEQGSEDVQDLEHLKNSAWQGQYSSGYKTKLGKHSAWLSEARGNNYWGTSAIIFGKGRTIQIICVSQHEIIISSGKDSYKQQRENLARGLAQENDRKSTAGMCSELFQSVELEEDEDYLQPVSAYDRNKAARGAAVLQQESPDSATPPGMSLGDLGRKQRTTQSAHAASFEAVGDPDKVPAGFRWLGLGEVCQPECSRSRMLLPAAAVPVGETQEVFQLTLDHAVISLFVGRLRTWTGMADLPPSLWIQEKFANPMFGVTLLTSPKITPLNEIEKTVHGIPAKISRVRMVDAAGNVFVGEGAVFKITGNIGIGCLIPENKFGEFEPVCSRMIDSLQVE